MNAIVSAIQLTTSASKRRSNRPRPLPCILLFLALSYVLLPRCCTSLKISDGFSLLSLRNSGRRNNGCFRRPNQCSVEPTASTKSTRPKLSSSASDASHRDNQVLRPELLFPTHRPLLAIITETDACETEGKMNHTYETVKKATSTGKVDLVSVRLSLPPRCDENGDENQSYHQVLERACRLTKELVALSEKQKLEQEVQIKDDNEDINTDAQFDSSFVVVCSSDLVSVAAEARANGVHVKEHHLDRLPDIVRQFEYPIVIGTSTHSVESALSSYFCDSSDFTRPKPHYYFVGTCYLTASHPEKTLQSQLEGPELPGRVKRALEDGLASKQVDTAEAVLPRIMAIGGIDETNCQEPVALGADGVAVIRAILQADHPIERVEDMQAAMLVDSSSTHQQ